MKTFWTNLPLTIRAAVIFCYAYALFVAACAYLVCRLIAYTVEVGLTWLFPPALGPVLTAVGMAGIGVINYVRLRRTLKD